MKMKKFECLECSRKLCEDNITGKDAAGYMSYTCPCGHKDTIGFCCTCKEYHYNYSSATICKECATKNKQDMKPQ